MGYQSSLYVPVKRIYKQQQKKIELNIKFRALNISFQLADMSKGHALPHLILKTTYNLGRKQKLKKNISI